MCDFPSWIETDDAVLFLTDADLNNPALEGRSKDDLVGHSAIRAVYPGAGGTDREWFPCHPDVAKAIRAGKMKQLMHADGYESVTVNAKGQLHSFRDKPAVVWASGSKWWCRDGKRHREGDKPAIVYANGEKSWYRNDKFIRSE